MSNRRVTPLTPNAMAPCGSIPSSPARLSTTNVSPARRNPSAKHKNSSDGVAAVLGMGGASPTRQGNSPMRRPRGVSQPALPGVGVLARGVGGLASSTHAIATPATPSGAGGGGGGGFEKPLGYECKVLQSGGKTCTKPLALTVGVGCLQGFRPTMEDAHFSFLNHRTVDGVGISMFGILDGHCGRRVADLGCRWVPECYFAHPSLAQNNAQALAEAVIQADKKIFSTIGKTDGGSTLITAVVQQRMLFVACLGDARAVLLDGTRAVALSEDHKPLDPKETARVQRCGGVVQFGRVCGCLAVSRALGDYEFKFTGTTYVSNRELMVSNVPDITQINLTDSTRMLILACDGLWDVLTNDEAASFVVTFLNKADTHAPPSRTLDQCAMGLADYAIERGSMDNVSVMLVAFHDLATWGGATNAGGNGGGGVANGTMSLASSVGGSGHPTAGATPSTLGGISTSSGVFSASTRLGGSGRRL